MHLGYVEYIVPGEKPGEGSSLFPRGSGRAATGEAGARVLFLQLDTNEDGLVTRDEIREQMPNNANASGPIFDRLDSNGDDKLDKQEFEALCFVGIHGGSGDRTSSVPTSEQILYRPKPVIYRASIIEGWKFLVIDVNDCSKLSGGCRNEDQHGERKSLLPRCEDNLNRLPRLSLLYPSSIPSW